MNWYCYFRMQPVVFELGKISETLHAADMGVLHLPDGVTQVATGPEDLDERYGTPVIGKSVFIYLKL